MNSEFRKNHYVPVWYQKRFLFPNNAKCYRLDLKPEVIDNNGNQYTRKACHYWSPKKIFVQEDLYTTTWGFTENTDIEQFFFGEIDTKSKKAVEYFADFVQPSANGDKFQTFLQYMSLQKLRTPKGLNEFSNLIRTQDPNRILFRLQELANLFCATWTECVWQIADATQSNTKFILSDHPVTVYNRAIPPLSSFTRKYGDPDIRQHATHTFFPLSLNKVLILTNLSWLRNPYQNEKGIRPNPTLLRNSIFSFLDIQTERFLTEREVLEINFITKSRAFRYVSGAKKEWLFPEKHLQKQSWKKIGNGYLFMPEPRLLHMGGEILIGYEGGRSDAFSEYGHKPWQEGYKDDKRFQRESKSFDMFKAEWAAIHGPEHTACSYHWHDGKRGKDSNDTANRYKDIRRARRKKK